MEKIRVLYAIYIFLLIISTAVGVGVQFIVGNYGYVTTGALSILSSAVAIYLLVLLGKGTPE